MQKFLKAAAVATAMALVATAAFGADFKARMYINGDVLAMDADNNFKAFGINNKDIKDEDLFLFKVDGEKAGVYFRFYADNFAEDGDLHMRGAKIWYKPIDMLKINFGSVSTALYTERMDWWEVPTGNKATAWGDDAERSSYASVEGVGYELELTPIAGLTVSGGMIREASMYDHDNDPTNADVMNTFFYNGLFDTKLGAFGLLAKYSITDAISAGVAYRQAANEGPALIRAGADFGNYGTPYYGFVTLIARIEGEKLTGLSIDNYIKYQMGDFGVQAALPVTIRMTEDATDYSFIRPKVKLTYAANGFTFYEKIVVKPLTFGSENMFSALENKLGAEWNVDALWFDICFQANVGADSFAWSIPFQVSYSF